MSSINISKTLSFTDDEICRIFEHIKAKTAQPAFTLTLNFSRTPTVFDTKIGGLPYWDKSVEFPKGADNERLALLAQLNMSDFKDNALLPDKGILQFFISSNNVYGMNFNDLTDQTSFRVVYHESINTNVVIDDIKNNFITSKDVDTECYDLPFTGEFALDVNKITSFMGDSDYRFMGLLEDSIAELDIAKREEFEASDVLSEMPVKMRWELQCSGNRVLGYPYFTQYDVRDDEAYRDYDILLLQIDSDMNNKSIMWGDVGVANFFIRSEDLKNKDFSKVIYTWDCC